MKAAVDDYQQTQPIVDGKCVQVQVESRGAADVAKELPTAQINPPALWVPDSSMWAAEAQRLAAEQGPDAPRLDLQDPLATSPLLIAGSEQSMTKLGWPITPIAWAKVVDPAANVQLTDPTTSTEGLAALAVIRAQPGNPDGTPKPELIGALLKVGRNALPSVRDSFGRVEQGLPEAPVFTASEQSVLAANRAAGARNVVASYPREGTISFDYPLVRVSRTGEQPGTAKAAQGFEQALRNTGTRQHFTDAGFRTTDGKPPPQLTTDKDGLGGDDVAKLKPPPRTRSRSS